MAPTLTSPMIKRGMIVYDPQRNQALGRYQSAVKRAGFLTDEEKEQWILLAYFLDSRELAEAEQAILGEDLKRLHVRQQLSHLKKQKN